MSNPEFVQVGNLRLRVSRHGEGPPLLLVTGIGANIEMWKPLEDALSGFELVAFDPPGAGRSSRTPVPVRMRRLADIVVNLLDVLGYEMVDVLGYSFGGALVQQLVRVAPERIDRVILAGTMSGLGGTIPPGPRVFAHMLTPYRYYSRRYLAAISPGLYGGRSRRDPESIRCHEDARLSSPPSVLGYVWQIAAIWGWTSVPWLRTIKHRTLIITGDDDPIVRPINARILATLLPNATLEVIPGGGHLVLLDQAADAAPLIAEFLHSNRGSDG